jgi:ABC-2 type transport system ATP-binding protein
LAANKKITIGIFMSFIETHDLTKSFKALVAVDRLNLCVETGATFGLLGPNGAGKTTTLKMLTTLLPPTSGRATIAGLDVVHRADSVRRLIGYVPQMLSADGTLTGYENLLVFARLYDLPRKECNARVREALDFMNLSDSADKMVREYSGGMIRRLEIAQSMLHRPPLLFLDEPTVGLDPGARRAVWEHIEQLRSQFGITILLTTHLMEEADVLCSRVAIMHHGKVVAIGSPAELKAQVGGDVTLDDVFIHFTGDELNSGGSYRETSRTRRTARRLG